MSTDEINQMLLGSGAKSFAFENIGDTVSGEIVNMAMREQTDLQTGEIARWSNGDAKKVIVITLQTALRDSDDDDGIRTVWARGGNYVAEKGKGGSTLNAIRDAVRASGAKEIMDGGKLTVAYTGEGKRANKGFSPPKLYTATYQAPTANIALDDLI